MKKILSLLLVLFLIISSAYATGNSAKDFQVNITGFMLTYNMLMSGFHEKTNMSIEWYEGQNRAMMYLTANSFIMVDTQSRRETSMIKELLFVATAGNKTEYTSAMCSMAATIYSVNPEIGLEGAVDMVTKILLNNNEYKTKECIYKFETTANAYMLYISPRK